MPTSVRLDKESEELLAKTANVLKASKSAVLKASIQSFCKRALQEKTKRPYDLIADLIGKEFSGKGNLAFDHEVILRNRLKRKGLDK